MNLQHAPGALLLSLPLLLVSPSVELEFTPEEGESVTVTYEMLHELELTGLEQVTDINGEENEAEIDEVPTSIRKTVENIQFTDDYLAVDDGRLIKVERTYEVLSMVVTAIGTDEDGDEVETVDEGESELLDTAVTFTWDEDEDEYTKAFSDEDSELDEALLEKLKMTGQLIRLLTDADVEEGQDWEFDVAVFHEMAAPGGDHSVIMESEAAAKEDAESEEDDEDEEYSRQFEDNLDGTAVAEFIEIREEDGVEVAVISLTVELTSEIELVQTVNVNLDINDERQTGDGTITKEHEVYYDLSGELWWDIEGGRAISLVLEGDSELELLETFATEVGEFSMERRTTTTFEGTVKHTITLD